MKRVILILLISTSISTLLAQEIDSIIDIRDDQIYKVVKIGQQWWMQENLNIGIMIDSTLDQQYNDIIEKYYYHNSDSLGNIYGGLYQWDEMTNYEFYFSGNPDNVITRGICPTGWHLPSDTEWKKLEMSLGMSQNEAYGTGYRGTDEGGKMKETGTIHWNSPNQDATNSSGFTALPAGYLNYNSEEFNLVGEIVYFWSSTSMDYEGDGLFDTWYRGLSANSSQIIRNADFYRGYGNNNHGISVRCLRDSSQFSNLTITDKNLNTITNLEFAPDFENDTILIFNFGAGKTININSFHTSTSAYSFNYSSAVLPPGDSIHLNILFDPPTSGFYNDTLYIESDDTYRPVIHIPLNGNLPIVDSIIDIRDGQDYKIVKIGQQWWMQENLNIGNLIEGMQNASDNSIIEKYCYQDITNNCKVYGGLYQWDEMMAYNPSDNGYTGTTRGVCPINWHLPTDGEWAELTDFLGGESGSGGKLKEVGNTHWSNPNTGATNWSGFLGIPGGIRDDGSSFGDNGYFANFWSSAENSSNDAWYRRLSFNEVEVDRDHFSKEYGFSVRCLRDSGKSSYLNIFDKNLENILSLDFYNNKMMDTIIIYNINAGKTININSISTATSAYHLTRSSAVLPPGDSIHLSVALNICERGNNYTDTLYIESDDPFNSLITIPLMGHIDQFIEPICIVTIDMITGKNIVVWEKTPDVGIAAYNIYRESTIGVYNKIGTVSVDELSIFKDTTANPESRSYLYKITAVDTCGNESPLENSKYHRPSFLQWVSSAGGINLEWTDYNIEGIGNIGEYLTSYAIYRGTDSTSLTEYEVVGSINTYTDTDPNAITEKYYYRVAAILKDPCIPTIDKKAETGPYSHSMSNMEDNRFQTGMSELLLSNENLMIYPNPFNGSTIIKFRNQGRYSYTLFLKDLTGKVIKAIDNITGEKIELNRDGLPAGLYFIELRGPKIYRGKIVIE